MIIRVRLSGDPGELASVIDALRNRFDLAGGERAYPNRGAFGVRVYLEIRPHQRPGTVDRTDRAGGAGGADRERP